MSCREDCTMHRDIPPVPAEPEVGTWVKDRFGAVHQRRVDIDGHDGWGEPGFYSFGKWEAMWEARGPLVECGPWGAELIAGQACPSCGQLTRWDETHRPNAWRHVETDTRWCSLDGLPDGERGPRFPDSAGNRLRRAEPYRTNAELWK